MVTALQFAPVLLLTLLSGRLADRYDKRLLLFVAQRVLDACWRSGMSLLVAHRPGGALARLRLRRPARRRERGGDPGAAGVRLRDWSAPPLLPNALSLNAAVFNSARIVGPAVAGLAIAAVDVGPVFLFTAVSSLAPLVTVVRMRPAELYREALLPSRERDSAQVVDGLRLRRGAAPTCCCRWC